MKRGRRPKPTKLKVIQGTARPSRLNSAEPQVDPCLPDPPGHLSPEALQEWHRVAPELAACGVLTRLDRAILAAYSQAFGRWRQAENALERFAEKDPATKGIMMKTTSGNAIQNPLVGAANKAMSDVVRYGNELGLTPSSRARVDGLDVSSEPGSRFFD